MEELVPLENKNRKKFEKKVKGIQSMIKTGKIKLKEDETVQPKRNDQHTQKRGVVYIGHLPHGFYEDQLRGFFGQFGKVTNVRVARSKRNGRSKGYAFVQFRDTEVAEIAAETMNNYLMDKRLLKAEYIPPEKQGATLFKGKNWIQGKYAPGIINKMKNKLNYNKTITDAEWLATAKKTLKKVRKIKEELKKNGIDYDFFQPCDIPEELLKSESAPEKPKETSKSSETKSEEARTIKKKKEKKPTTQIQNIEKAPKQKKIDSKPRSLLTFKIDEEDKNVNNEKVTNKKKQKSKPPGQSPQKNIKKVQKKNDFNKKITKNPTIAKNNKGKGKKNKN